MSKIDFSQVMKDKQAYLTMTEIQRILNYCLAHDKLRDYMLTLTLARTGRRITEIVGRKPYTHYVGLRPIDIKDDLIEWDILKKNPIHTHTRKGKLINATKIKDLHLHKKPNRTLKPADEEYITFIQTYIEEYGIGQYNRIFPITRRRAGYIIKDIAQKAGVTRPNKNIHPHMFRHSLAINLLKNNPNNPYILLQIQRILDHSSIQVTTTYTQFTPEDIKESLNKLFIGDKQ